MCVCVAEPEEYENASAFVKRKLSSKESLLASGVAR